MESIKVIAPLLSTAASFLFLLVGAVAVLAMMLRMGTNGVSNPERYVRIHRVAGWSFATIFFGMFAYMLTRVVHYNDEFSPRIALHFTLATVLFCLLAFKIAVPRVFPNFGRHLFLLGSGVYVLAFPMVLISGGYHLEKMVTREPYVYHDNFIRKFADDNLGKEFLVTKCATCHPLAEVLKPRSEKAWGQVMDRMLLLASPRLSVDEAGQVLAYLNKYYSPRRIEIPAGASPVDRHCLPCHDATDIFRTQYNLVAWEAIIGKMSDLDDKIVPPDKVKQIAAFMTATQKP
jgi:hypothetical protein